MQKKKHSKHVKTRILYHFSCGCVTDAPVRSPKKTWTCPEHVGAQLVQRQTFCKDCGAPLLSGPWGGLRKRCPVCSKKASQEYMRHYKRVLRPRPSQGLPRCLQMSPERHRDCLHYNACMTPGTGRLMKNSRACQGCPDYVPGAGLDVVDFLVSPRRPDTFDNCLLDLSD